MKEKRGHKRFPLGLNARYTLPGDFAGACRVTDVSFNGMAFDLFLLDGVLPGTHLNVDVCLPPISGQLSSSLTIKWMAPANDRPPFNMKVGGIIRNMPAADKRNLLELAFGNWFKQV